MVGSERGNQCTVYFVFIPVPGRGHWKVNTLLLIFPLGNALQRSLSRAYGLREHWSEVQLVESVLPEISVLLVPYWCLLTCLPDQGKCLPPPLDASLRSHDNWKGSEGDRKMRPAIRCLFEVKKEDRSYWTVSELSEHKNSLAASDWSEASPETLATAETHCVKGFYSVWWNHHDFMHHAFCLVQSMTKAAKYIILLNMGHDCKGRSTSMLIHPSSTAYKVCCCLAAQLLLQDQYCRQRE